MSSTDDRGLGTRPEVARRKVARLRATVGRIAAGQVEQLRAVVEVAEECAAAARHELAGTVRASGRPSVEELTHTTVVHEVTVILGIPKWEAEKLVERASQLVGVLPDTLGALEAGRIDLARAQVLVDETRFLDDACARAVEALVLQKVADTAGRGPACRRGGDGPRSSVWWCRSTPTRLGAVGRRSSCCGRCGPGPKATAAGCCRSSGRTRTSRSSTR